MNARGLLVSGALPVPVLAALGDFEVAFTTVLRVVVPPSEPGAASEVLFASSGFDSSASVPDACRRTVKSPEGPDLELQVCSADGASPADIARALQPVMERLLEAEREARFFTYELSERFEEINLLYSISETLGSTLDVEAAANKILTEVRDVMGAKRGSLWVYDAGDDALHLAAAVGDTGREGPLAPHDPDAITSMVFREGQAIIASRGISSSERKAGQTDDSFLSVPIRYTPSSGESTTVGVVNLIGRQDGGRFSAANQKLLAAIASQVGAALENHRLVRESLSNAKMTKEMELAHDLQMKLLPITERIDWAQAAGRVQPAEQVGGDFYQLFKLSDGKIGVLLGDVSLHGFPSALIMTLTLSAAGIYARGTALPSEVLRGLDDALSEELETTEMFVTVFYGVIDAAAGTLAFSNAGHPHAFAVHEDGTTERLLATDPPVGFAGPDSYSETCIPWDPEKDFLLLFTDGLSDMLASETRGDGETLVLETVVQHRFDRPANIVSALFNLSADADPPNLGDDRTVLVVRT